MSGRNRPLTAAEEYDLHVSRDGRDLRPAVLRMVAVFRPPPATDRDLRWHLVELHRMPAEVVDAHTPAEHRVWHAAEHRGRDAPLVEGGHDGVRVAVHAGHLRHHHHDTEPTPRRAA